MEFSNPYIEGLTNKLIELNPHLVLLFGSYATGTPHSDSDIDILVVTQDDFIPQSFKEKTALYLQIIGHIEEIADKVPIDLLVYTLPMYKKFIELNSAFAKEISNTAKILYENNHTGMA